MGRKCGIEWFLKEEQRRMRMMRRFLKKIAKRADHFSFAGSECPGDLRK